MRLFGAWEVGVRVEGLAFSGGITQAGKERRGDGNTQWQVEVRLVRTRIWCLEQ